MEYFWAKVSVGVSNFFLKATGNIEEHVKRSSKFNKAAKLDEKKVKVFWYIHSKVF